MHPLAAYLFNSEGKTEDLHSRDLSVQTLPEKPAQLLQNFNTLKAPQGVQIHKSKLVNLERYIHFPNIPCKPPTQGVKVHGNIKGFRQDTGKHKETSLGESGQQETR